MSTPGPLVLAEKVTRNIGELLFGDRELVQYRFNSRFLPRYYSYTFRRRVRSMAYKNPMFVDCGANIGQGFGIFSKIFSPETFDYALFEANPLCMTQLNTALRDSTFRTAPQVYNKAVWVEPTTLKFYGVHETGDEQTQAGSVKNTHNNLAYVPDDKDAMDVEAIDFVGYLEDVQKDHDLVVIKMDIEGAELEVLEHMWRNADKITRPTIMFVEFHSVYQEAKQRLLDAQREKFIKTNVPENVELHMWY